MKKLVLCVFFIPIFEFTFSQTSLFTSNLFQNDSIYHKIISDSISQPDQDNYSLSLNSSERQEYSLATFSQAGSSFNELPLDTLTRQKYFPTKTLGSQRWAWRENGFLRGKTPITPEARFQDIGKRQNMLGLHQAFALVTFAGFIAQGIVGSQLYNDPTNKDLNNIHGLIGGTVNLTYFTAAYLVLFAPPPRVKIDYGPPAVRWHRHLAAVHFTGMIVTNILAGLISGGNHPELRPYHAAAAFTTFAAYTAALLVIKIR